MPTRKRISSKIIDSNRLKGIRIVPQCIENQPWRSLQSLHYQMNYFQTSLLFISNSYHTLHQRSIIHFRNKTRLAFTFTSFLCVEATRSFSASCQEMCLVAALAKAIRGAALLGGSVWDCMNNPLCLDLGQLRISWDCLI